MRQVSSILRHDLANQGNPDDQSGLSFFHLSIGGFDTHSEQGADDPNAWHPTLMRWISEAMTGFQRDLEALGLADKVVTMTYSEFGRRIEQNDSGRDAGTDHGTASGMFVMGGPGAPERRPLRPDARPLGPRRQRQHEDGGRLPRGVRGCDPVARRRTRAP